jgi:hypothetical protein
MIFCSLFVIVSVSMSCESRGEETKTGGTPTRLILLRAIHLGRDLGNLFSDTHLVVGVAGGRERGRVVGLGVWDAKEREELESPGGDCRG